CKPRKLHCACIAGKVCMKKVGWISESSNASICSSCVYSWATGYDRRSSLMMDALEDSFIHPTRSLIHPTCSIHPTDPVILPEQTMKTWTIQNNKTLQ